MPDEVVYVIGAADSNVVKIGRTGNLDQRLGTIQRMCPLPLGIRLRTKGGRELESALHQRFKSMRVHGEWFDFGEKDPVGEVAIAVRELEPLAAVVTGPLADKRATHMQAVMVANQALDDALEDRRLARAELGKAVADAIRRGVKPTVLIRKTGLSAETIRTWARENGVEPLREPTTTSIRKMRERLAAAGLDSGDINDPSGHDAEPGEPAAG